jgi:branched-chain amino acid transport system substrate-binding protein
MKKFTTTLFLIFALVITSGVVVAQDEETELPPLGAWEECAAPESLPEVVTIGAIFGLSEGVSVYGIPQRQSVELAVAEMNENGYFGEGTTLEVIFEDSQGNAEQAIAAMTKLVEEDQVAAVLGPTLSTEAFSADPIAQENGVPVMGVSNTAIGITDMGNFVFRNSLPESAVIPGTIEQAVAAFDIDTVGIMYGDDDDFTISGYDVFLDALEENNIEIVATETFAIGDLDYSAQLTNIIGEDIDALVLSSLADEAVQIINQARELGFEGTIIGGNGLNSPTVIDGTGENSEGVIVGSAWNIGDPDPTPSSVAFQEAFEEAYDNQPDQFSAQAYTGAWLMGTAIRCADSADPAAIRDALAEIEDFDSPLGAFSFSEDRNPIHDPVAQIVQDGAFVPLASVVEMDDEAMMEPETTEEADEG